MPTRKSKTDKAMAELAKIRKEERRLEAREKKAVSVIKRERDKYQRELDRCRTQKKAIKKRAKKKATKKRATKKKAAKKKTTKKRATKKKSKRKRPMMRIQTLRDRIAAAAYELGGNRTATRVRISAVRERLPDVSRAALDRALLQGQDDDVWTLYRDDVKRRLTPAEHAAALDVAGSPRHLLYLDPSAPPPA